MDDLGAPIAHLAVAEGAPVYDRDGEEVGAVEHVLTDEGTGIFDGLIVDTSALPGGHRFADADQIAELRERGVILAVAADALHEPHGGAAVMEVQPEDTTESDLEAKLRRAWDWISGRY